MKIVKNVIATWTKRISALAAVMLQWWASYVNTQLDECVLLSLDAEEMLLTNRSTFTASQFWRNCFHFPASLLTCFDHLVEAVIAGGNISSNSSQSTAAAFRAKSCY